MKLLLPIAGFFIALSGCFFELILGNLEYDTTDLSAIKIIEKYGYPAESHLIETEDGYFLQLHRIPHGKNSTSTSSKKSLLLLHGALTSSDSYLLLGPNSFQGTTCGWATLEATIMRNFIGLCHLRVVLSGISRTVSKFHEIGLYDLPAQIDYICNCTQRNKVTLLGYSLGTTVLLVMATTRPDYQKKVRAAVLIAAPSVFIHQKSLFLPLAPAYPLAYSKSFANSEVFGDNPMRRILLVILGFLEEVDTRISKNLHLLSQKTGIQEYAKVVWYLLRFYPSSSSMKVFTHYFQLAISGIVSWVFIQFYNSGFLLAGKFRQYDYGPAENLIKYKNSEPPEYNLESITIPMSLTFTPNDGFAGEEDEEFLMKRMTNIKSVLKIRDKDFHHLDFIFGKNNKELVYDKVLDLMENL